MSCLYMYSITNIFKSAIRFSVTNYFLVNLSVADLLVTIVCMPNAMWNSYSSLWIFGHLSCKIARYLQCKYIHPQKRSPLRLHRARAPIQFKIKITFCIMNTVTIRPRLLDYLGRGNLHSKPWWSSSSARNFQCAKTEAGIIKRTINNNLRWVVAFSRVRFSGKGSSVDFRLIDPLICFPAISFGDRY